MGSQDQGSASTAQNGQERSLSVSEGRGRLWIHVDSRVDSLAVQKQKFLVVGLWDIWVGKNSGGRKQFEYQ